MDSWVKRVEKESVSPVQKLIRKAISSQISSAKFQFRHEMMKDFRGVGIFQHVHNSGTSYIFYCSRNWSSGKGINGKILSIIAGKDLLL